MRTDPFAPTHPLLDLSDELETASDECARAWEAEAEAKNDYQREHSVAYARVAAAGIASTSRSKEADTWPQVAEAKCRLNLAEARAKATKLHFEGLQSRSMLTMAFYKQTAMQDGGAR